MTRPLPRPLAPRAALLTLLAAAALAPPALAEPPRAEDPAMRAAKRHYDRGQKLFALQRFGDALEQFQRAFDAHPIPDFLFNIGQCHRNLGDYEAAIFSFKRYLKLEPDAPNRERVEELIEQLEEKQAAEDARALRLRPARDPAPAADRGPREDRGGGAPLYRRWWFWTGVLVAGAAGGVGYYALTSGDGPPDTTLGTNIVFGK